MVDQLFHQVFQVQVLDMQVVVVVLHFRLTHLEQLQMEVQVAPIQMQLVIMELLIQVVVVLLLLVNQVAVLLQAVLAVLAQLSSHTLAHNNSQAEL
jgi:hypothetical protein